LKTKKKTNFFSFLNQKILYLTEKFHFFYSSFLNKIKYYLSMTNLISLLRHKKANINGSAREILSEKESTSTPLLQDIFI
jgi:hypothetical protein